MGLQTELRAFETIIQSVKKTNELDKDTFMTRGFIVISK